MIFEIMQACIILHNMIVDDERDKDDLGDEYIVNGALVGIEQDCSTIYEYLRRHNAITNPVCHIALWNDLVEHL